MNGDQNTHYFNLIVNHRRMHRRIGPLKDKNDEWQENQSKLSDMALSYFSKYFLDTQNEVSQENLSSYNLPCLSPKQILYLNAPFSREEIEKMAFCFSKKTF